MTHPQELPINTVQLYATAPYPCSYLPHKEARSQVATPSHLVHDDVYAGLIAQGFRRSGLFTYRPHCDGCQACVPVRVLAHGFKPTRSQKRIWAKHQHLEVRVLPVAFDPAHYALYQSYQHVRHAGGGMDNDSTEQYRQFLLQSRVNTRLIEFWQPGTDTQDKELVMVSIMDVLSNGCGRRDAPGRWPRAATMQRPLSASAAHSRHSRRSSCWRSRSINRSARCSASAAQPMRLNRASRAR